MGQPLLFPFNGECSLKFLGYVYQTVSHLLKYADKVYIIDAAALVVLAAVFYCFNFRVPQVVPQGVDMGL